MSVLQRILDRIAFWAVGLAPMRPCDLSQLDALDGIERAPE